MDEEKLEKTEYYLNLINGDIYLINWASNRPTGEEWVQIEELCYKNLTSGMANFIGVA